MSRFVFNSTIHGNQHVVSQAHVNIIYFNNFDVVKSREAQIFNGTESIKIDGPSLIYY